MCIVTYFVLVKDGKVQAAQPVSKLRPTKTYQHKVSAGALATGVTTTTPSTPTTESPIDKQQKKVIFSADISTAHLWLWAVHNTLSNSTLPITCLSPSQSNPFIIGEVYGLQIIFSISSIYNVYPNNHSLNVTASFTVPLLDMFFY